MLTPANAPPPLLTHTQRVDLNLPVARRIIKDLQERCMGPDLIPVQLVRKTGPNFARAVCLFHADGTHLLACPPEVVEGAYTMIPKNALAVLLDKHRHIRATSVLGTVVEKLTIHPVFPYKSSYLHILPTTQFAGRRNHSAEQLAFILHALATHNPGLPFYIVFLDITKAFDRTWREAIYRLLALEHGKRAAAEIMALYCRVRSRVRHGTELSDFLEFLIGIGQGSPSSTPKYALFLKPLNNALREEGVCFNYLGIIFHCLFFLDDVAIPCTSQAMVKSTLNVTYNFGRQNKIEWNTTKGKSGVLCLTGLSDTPPWPRSGNLSTSPTSSAPRQHLPLLPPIPLHLSPWLNSPGSPT
jgi:hypothetical protein